MKTRNHILFTATWCVIGAAVGLAAPKPGKPPAVQSADRKNVQGYDSLSTALVTIRTDGTCAELRRMGIDTTGFRDSTITTRLPFRFLDRVRSLPSVISVVLSPTDNARISANTRAVRDYFLKQMAGRDTIDTSRVDVIPPEDLSIDVNGAEPTAGVFIATDGTCAELLALGIDTSGFFDSTLATSIPLRLLDQVQHLRSVKSVTLGHPVQLSIGAPGGGYSRPRGGVTPAKWKLVPTKSACDSAQPEIPPGVRPVRRDTTFNVRQFVEMWYSQYVIDTSGPEPIIDLFIRPPYDYDDSTVAKIAIYLGSKESGVVGCRIRLRDLPLLAKQRGVHYTFCERMHLNKR